MPMIWFRLFAICLVCIVTQAALYNPVDVEKKQKYRILKSSKLYLKGTSNVNSFTCTCNDNFPSQVFDVENHGKQVRFSSARLRMTTKKFNCQNGKIDRDMHKALKADDFQYISIELIETWYDPEHFKNGNSDQWSDVKATVKLTITDVTKTQTIQATAKKINANRFALRGEKTIKMTDYGIDPPDALFGLIKVNDQITFHFYLEIEVDDIVENG